MKTFLSIALALSSLCIFARDTNRYDNVYTDANGVTWTQRGGMGPSNYVATAANPGDMFQAITDGSSPVKEQFAAAVGAVAPQVSQDFRATSLTQQDKFFQNLETNKTPAYTVAFSNAVVRFSPPMDTDATKLTNYDALFDNIRTGKTASVSGSFSNAVVRYSPPTDMATVKSGVIGSVEFTNAVNGIAGTKIEGPTYVLDSSDMKVKALGVDPEQPFYCTIGGITFPMEFDPTHPSYFPVRCIGTIPSSLLADPSTAKTITIHLAESFTPAEWYAYFSSDLGSSQYVVSGVTGTRTDTSVTGTVKSGTTTVRSDLIGTPVLFSRTFQKTTLLRDLTKSPAQDAMTALSDSTVSNSIRSIVSDVPVVQMQGWYWDSTGTNGAFVTVYGNGTAKRELKQIWYTSEAATSNATVNYNWPKYIGYAPVYDSMGGVSVANGGASNVLWRKTANASTYAIAPLSETQVHFTKYNSYVADASAWVSAMSSWTPITLDSSSAKIRRPTAGYWKGSYYANNADSPLVTGINMSTVIENYWNGTGNLGGTGNTSYGNMTAKYSASYWYFLEDRSANDSGELHHQKTVVIPYTKYIPHTNDVGTAWVNFTQLTETDPTVPDWAKADDPPESGKIDAVKVNGVQLPVDTTDPTNKFVNVTVPTDETIDTMVTTKLNAYKELHWDPGLSVTWTNVYNNGHVYMVTVTNTNVSVAP